jgi:hypothetical protein
MTTFFISSESNPDLNSPNNPINLQTILQVSKEEMPILEVNYPCICFIGTNITWVYKNKTNRDKDFNKILGIEEAISEEIKVKKINKGK